MTDDELEGLVTLRLTPRNKRLVDARREKGLTQKELADLMGWKQWQVSHAELLRLVPSRDEQDFFAKWLEKPPDYLFPDSLLEAMRTGVFDRRYAELEESHLLSLTEAQRLRLSYGDTEMIEEVDRKALAERIESVMEDLTPREQTVLRWRFGLEDGAEHTCLDIAERAEGLRKEGGPSAKPLTRDRIAQIERKALRKLRYPRNSRVLKDFL